MEYAQIPPGIATGPRLSTPTVGIRDGELTRWEMVIEMGVEWRPWDGIRVGM